MAAPPFRHRWIDVDPNTWTRWKLERIRANWPALTLAQIAAGAGLPRKALYDWRAGRRRFGRRRLARLDRWARRLL